MTSCAPSELDKAQTKLAKGLVQITSADASKPCYPEGHLLDHRFMLAISLSSSTGEKYPNESHPELARCKVRNIDDAIIRLGGEEIGHVGDIEKMGVDNDQMLMQFSRWKISIEDPPC
jgi:hypothetical protein